MPAPSRLSGLVGTAEQAWYGAVFEALLLADEVAEAGSGRVSVVGWARGVPDLMNVAKIDG